MTKRKGSLRSEEGVIDAMLGLTEEPPIQEEKGSPAQAKRRRKKRELKQTTLMAYEDQIEWMDEVCFNARKGGGKSVAKAALLRELIDFARDHNLDLRGIQDEKEIKDRLREAVVSS